MVADVRVGVAGWGAPELYPEGLLAEWRVAYYAMLYSCVWLDRADWTGLSPAVAETWLQETDPGFRFVMDGAEPVGDETAAALAVLGARLVRVAGEADPDLIWFDAGTDLAGLADELRLRADAAGQVFLLSRGGNLAQLEQVKSLVELLGL